MYRTGVLEAEGFRSRISRSTSRSPTRSCGRRLRPANQQLDELASELGLHELAVENASNLISGRMVIVAVARRQLDLRPGAMATGDTVRVAARRPDGIMYLKTRQSPATAWGAWTPVSEAEG
jgi:hypothetical protein